MKDDSGGYAVFTEHGSSASQMTAAKVMDVIARLLECDGHAADAVSACTEYRGKKWKTLQKLLKIPKSECPDVWTHLPEHKWPQSRNNIVDPVVSFERNLFGHPIAGLLWEGQFEKSLVELGLGKGDKWGMPICSQKTKSYSCRSVWTTAKWLEESRNVAPYVEEIGFSKKKKTSILKNQHHFLITFT